jgi:nicotinate-nucleotide adenylyltransferase
LQIGILGGTFDPIHFGHLIVAEEVRIRLELEKIIFIPAGQPWLKAAINISPVKHRVEMVQLAINSNPYFQLSTLEADRPGPSYTIDTLTVLHQEFGEEVKIFFLLGIDILPELLQWKDPQHLIQMCHLVALTRPGCSSPDLSSLERAISGISSRITLLEVPEIGISSTRIRNRVAQGISILYLVPEAVERYILEKGLYSMVEVSKGD